MRWIVYAVPLWCFTNLVVGGALKCSSDSKDESCKDLNQPELVEDPGQESGGGKETEKQECEPGSEWASNCHSCRCSDAGLAKCTRQESCAGTYADPIRCKPNTTFQQQCNTCICLESGLGLCTLNGCSRTVTKKPSLPSGRDCLPNTFWKSKCNDCGCSPDGVAYCTEKACPGQENEPEFGCAPDSVWKNECNTCFCSGNGHAMCTKMGCLTLFNFEPTTTSLENPETGKDREPVTEVVAIDDEEVLNGLQTEATIQKLHEEQEGQHNPKSDVVKVENYDILSDADDKIQTKIENYEKAQDAEDEQKSSKPKDEVELIHEINKRSVTCKPNEEFQVECNSCKCSDDGQSYTCTQNECMDREERDMNKEVEVFRESEGIDHIERHSVCKARGTFYIGCNTCHCNYFGTDYSCTNKPCPLPEDVELFHELKALKIKPTTKPTSSLTNTTKTIVCVANRMFIMDCNTCWCNEDGTSFFCTRRVCIPEEIEEESDKPEDLRIIKKECRPDEVFELDCNMCRCNPDGKSFSCTRRACAEQTDETKNGTVLSRRARQTKETAKVCEANTEFRLDCNKCLCDNEGADFSCTRIDCAAVNTFASPVVPYSDGNSRTKREATREVPAECTPGSVFDRDCNVCRCTSDGKHALCTLNRCNKPTDKKDKQKDEDKNAPATDSSFRCNPGEQYKQRCNDCTCAADGLSVFCTLRFCDDETSAHL